jgi:hypothetical protein
MLHFLKTSARPCTSFGMCARSYHPQVPWDHLLQHWCDYLCVMLHNRVTFCVLPTHVVMWTLPKWYFCGDGITVSWHVAMCNACCGYVCLNVWLPLLFFWFQWFLFVFFCEVIIWPNMLRSTVAMLLFSTQLSFPEPCRLLCAAFYGCSCFCLCLNNVVTITHGMVVFFIVNTSSIPALWCQWFLSSMDAVVCPLLKNMFRAKSWFQWILHLYSLCSFNAFFVIEASSVVQATSLISHMVWSWFWWNIFLLCTL